MRILALEPYAALSHQRFLDGLIRHSRHEVLAETLPARHWKWRMRSASLIFAERLREAPPPDVLLVSDYLNLPETLALLPPTWRDVPAVVYFHENQLTYPLQEGERRDVHFGLTHLHSILAAREAWFNSTYHLRVFREALDDLVHRIPDVAGAALSDSIAQRSRVEPLGIEGPVGSPSSPTDVPIVLWNHRLEYDKGPDRLEAAVERLARGGERFRLRLVGERFREQPASFVRLRERFSALIDDMAFLPERADYEQALLTSDIVLSTARHEFFGIASIEAMRAGCLPVLPNDLAYPELVPAKDHAHVLYEPTDGAADTLAQALTVVRTGERWEERTHLIESLARFDWSERIADFDSGFDRVAACASR